MAWAPNGDLYVVDSGFGGFGADAPAQPIEIFKVSPSGQSTKVFSTVDHPGALMPTALGIAVQDDDHIYVNDGAGTAKGALKRLHRDGSIETIVDLSSVDAGDHNNDHIIFGKDGKLYWGEGSATNSGVVGNDNGWSKANPKFSDIPCKDVMLSGANWTTTDKNAVLSSDTSKTVVTGPFLPFGTAATPGQVIKGQLPCTSSILRANPDGSGLEMVAWGFRNPYALQWTPDDHPLKGAMVVLQNGADVRGTRPIENDADDMFVVCNQCWYGWPDSFDEVPVEEPRFTPTNDTNSARSTASTFWSPDRSQAVSAIAHFEKGTSADGLDFSTSDTFGFKHSAFVALFGPLRFGGQSTPAYFPGSNIERVEFKTVEGQFSGTQTSVFATNRVPGPASGSQTNAFEHPVDIKFSADGKTLYVLDLGFAGVFPAAQPVGVQSDVPSGTGTTKPGAARILAIRHQ
jgi:glucose/arabinose dehydrogenase